MDAPLRGGSSVDESDALATEQVDRIADVPLLPRCGSNRL